MRILLNSAMALALKREGGGETLLPGKPRTQNTSTRDASVPQILRIGLKHRLDLLRRICQLPHDLRIEGMTTLPKP